MFNPQEFELREQQRQEWIQLSERLRCVEQPAQKSRVDSALEKVGEWLIVSGTYLKERQGEQYGRADF
jgi:hypothetical protein